MRFLARSTIIRFFEAKGFTHYHGHMIPPSSSYDYPRIDVEQNMAYARWRHDSGVHINKHFGAQQSLKQLTETWDKLVAIYKTLNDVDLNTLATFYRPPKARP